MIELNGAVEFMREYAPWGDVLAETAAALAAAARLVYGPPVLAEAVV